MDVPLPPLNVSTALVPFVIVAVSMIVIAIVLFGIVLPADGRPPLLSQLTLALSVLAGGSVLLLSLVFVFLNPNGTESWTFVLLSFNFMMMAPAGLWFIGLIAFRDRRIEPASWLWPSALALVTTGSEALMGVLFALGGSTAPAAALPTLALGLSSIWFFWSMAAIMVVLVAWAPLSRVERWALFALTLAAVVGPWVTAFPTVGGASMAGLMGGLFVLLTRQLRLGPGSDEEAPFLIGLAVAFLVMTVAGLGVAITGGSSLSALAFGATMGTVMTVEIAYLVRRYYRGSWFAPWVPRRSDDELRPERPKGRAVPGLDALPSEAPPVGR
jgi:hypothetical protein